MKTRSLSAENLQNRNQQRLPIGPIAQSCMCLRVGDRSPWRLRVAWVALALLVMAIAFFWAGPPTEASPAWLPMSAPTGFTVTSVDFINADVGWVTALAPAAGEDPFSNSIFRTKDGGAHWESVYGPDPDLSLGPICFLNDQAGWVAATASGRDESGVIRFDDYVLHTADGGTTWTKTAVVLDVGVPYLNDIVFVNLSTGFIVGSDRWGRTAVIFRTSDGGAAWRLYDVEGAVWSPDGMEAASFPDSQNGWAVANWYSYGLGEGSAILRTADGGLSWQRQYGYEAEPTTGTQRWYWDVDFVETQWGWVVGERGLLLRTLDAGLVWQELAAPAAADLMAVDFLDPLEGWVAGREGFLLHTTDGGSTWMREDAATTADISDLELLDQTHGVAFAGADAGGEETLLAYGEASGFTDVASSPYQEAIEGLFAGGIVAGYQVPGGLQFRPGDSIRRAQFAKMIVGAMKLTVTEDLTSPFTDLGKDVLDDLYPHEYVAAAYAAGITVGLNPTTFGPFAEITRAQMVTMVVRAARNLYPDRLSVPPAGYAGTLGAFSPDHAESVARAEYNGLLEGLQGFGAGWDPWQAATRGEAAQILWALTGS